MVARPLDRKRQGITRPTWQNVPDFSEARSLFATYWHRRQVANSSNDDDDFFAEAEKRLDQLDTIVRRIVLLEREHDRIDRRIEKERSPLRQRAGMPRYNLTTTSIDIEVELLIEAFYYFAWRFVHIIRRVAFKTFNPKGVRDVRNHLVQHPDKPNHSVEIHDRGLFVNAQELIDQLVHRLRTAERESAGAKKKGEKGVK